MFDLLIITDFNKMKADSAAAEPSSIPESLRSRLSADELKLIEEKRKKQIEAETAEDAKEEEKDDDDVPQV